MDGLRDDELDAIEARERAATPGPWHENENDEGDGYAIESAAGPVVAVAWHDGPMLSVTINDAAFICAARTDVPALAAEVRRLRAQRSRDAAALDEAHALLLACVLLG